MKTKPLISELSNPQDVETYSEIVKRLWRDAKNEKKTALDKPIANRIEGASVRQKYAICNIISYLVRDSRLLMESDERNGKPYKLFGLPITAIYGRLVYSLYRAADIDRKFWLQHLDETDSDPKGMDKHLRRIFRDRRCQCPI